MRKKSRTLEDTGCRRIKKHEESANQWRKANKLENQIELLKEQIRSASDE